MNAQQWSKIMFLAGRLFVGVMYLGAGINHLVELRETAGHTASKGVIALRALVTMASTILIIAGFCFITRLVPRAGILAIVLFLIRCDADHTQLLGLRWHAARN